MDHQLNEEITDKEVRLIRDDGAQLGIMSAAAALEVAVERGLDLVKISPNAVPPVCRLMDYGKFRFEQAKREKEAKKAEQGSKEQESSGDEQKAESSEQAPCEDDSDQENEES